MFFPTRRKARTVTSFVKGSIAQNEFAFLYFSDERLSAGDERVESSRSNFHPTQPHVHM